MRPKGGFYNRWGKLKLYFLQINSKILAIVGLLQIWAIVVFFNWLTFLLDVMKLRIVDLGILNGVLILWYVKSGFDMWNDICGFHWVGIS